LIVTIRAFVAGTTLLAVSGLSYTGFDEGLAAHKRGDFITALSEWQPLAEQGDADAQSNLGAIYDTAKAWCRTLRNPMRFFLLLLQTWRELTYLRGGWSSSPTYEVSIEAGQL
jgi:hypothetical protein